jgi:hypothetical protein
MQLDLLHATKQVTELQTNSLTNNPSDIEQIPNVAKKIALLGMNFSHFHL